MEQKPVYSVTKPFFEACESGQGWEECQKYCHADATFSAQSEPLVNIKTLKEYTDWMKGLVTITMPGCSYDVKCWASNNTQTIVYAVFKGTHTGEQGPVAATNQSTNSDYVYVINVQDGKISSMTKIWNSMWAMRELGWA